MPVILKRTYPKQHIFKRLMHEKYPDFFYDYLIRKSLVEVDLNFIEIVNGKEETLIDYLDRLMDEK
ncbi:MAG: hypothetical protein RI573_16825 [Balneolaceae bacterium]|nr:hypothetical protein [Balneolaceae bacterium]